MKKAILIAACLALLVGILSLSHAAPGEALQSLIKGSLGSPTAIMGTLRETTPLLIAGAAVFFALQAGLFNVGVEGQLIVGALASAVVGLRVGGLPGVVLGVVAAIVAGALWALPVGLIKAYRNGHEVITTIMLNSVAGFVTTALVAGPFKDKKVESPTTATLDAATRLASFELGGVRVNLGLLIGIVCVTSVWWWLRKSVSGYELRATGANSRAAEFAGVDVRRAIVQAMLVSGGLAGLAGACQVLGYEGRYFAEFSPGYGFNSLGVALLAGPDALVVIPAGALFGVLTKGAASLGLLGIPRGTSNVVLGCLIAVAAAFRYVKAKGVRD